MNWYEIPVLFAVAVLYAVSIIAVIKYRKFKIKLGIDSDFFPGIDGIEDALSNQFLGVSFWRLPKVRDRDWKAKMLATCRTRKIPFTLDINGRKITIIANFKDHERLDGKVGYLFFFDPRNCDNFWSSLSSVDAMFSNSRSPNEEVNKQDTQSHNRG